MFGCDSNTTKNMLFMEILGSKYKETVDKITAEVQIICEGLTDEQWNKVIGVNFKHVLFMSTAGHSKRTPDVDLMTIIERVKKGGVCPWCGSDHLTHQKFNFTDITETCLNCDYEW
jgi:hypothetical protein